MRSAVALFTFVALIASASSVSGDDDAALLQPHTAVGEHSQIRDPELWRRLQDMSADSSTDNQTVDDEAPAFIPSSKYSESESDTVVHAVAHVPSWATPMTGSISLLSYETSEDAQADQPERLPFLDLDATDSPEIAASPSDPSNTDLALHFVTWTVIVLCLCVLTVLGVRKWQRNQGMLPLAGGNSKVLETVMIGPNRSVSLVQLRGLQAVVGCDASGIQSIVLAPQSFDDVLTETDAVADASTSQRLKLQ